MAVRETFPISGRRPVLEALERGGDFERLYLPQRVAGGDLAAILKLARNLGVPTSQVTPGVLREKAGHDRHQGVVLLPAARSYLTEEDLPEILAGTGLVLLLDRIQDPHNLGALLRTARAAGVLAVVIPAAKAVGVTGTVIKVSMGAALQLPIYRVRSLRVAARRFREAGFHLAGLTENGETPLFRVRWPRKTVLVVGNENNGISRELLAVCAETVSIPMPGNFPSLNASVSGALAVYEYLRQRNV